MRAAGSDQRSVPCRNAFKTNGAGGLGADHHRVDGVSKSSAILAHPCSERRRTKACLAPLFHPRRRPHRLQRKLELPEKQPTKQPGEKWWQAPVNKATHRKEAAGPKRSRRRSWRRRLRRCADSVCAAQGPGEKGRSCRKESRAGREKDRCASQDHMKKQASPKSPSFLSKARRRKPAPARSSQQAKAPPKKVSGACTPRQAARRLRGIKVPRPPTSDA